MSTLKISGTGVLAATLQARDAGYRYIVHQGATRSGKTYAICQALMLWAMEERVKIDIVRKTFPALRRDAMHTWEEVLVANELYREALHNKTENVYQVGQSEVEFSAADTEQKQRGPERDILYCSEANALSESDFRQLTRRTRDCVLMDYNPSHGSRHWIERRVKQHPQAIVLRSTYEHNAYLTPAQVADIEEDIPVYEEADGTLVRDPELSYDGDGILVKGNPEEWAVYGRGERAQSPALVYPHWQKRRWPDGLPVSAYGVDFGTAQPSTVIAIGIEEMPATHDDRLYWKEVVYEAGLTTPQIVTRLDAADVRKDVPMFCDHEQDRIDQLKDAGYLAAKANKSVQSGIDTVKQYALCITPGSQRMIEEVSKYSRKVVDGVILDQVIKEDDHAMDGGRYGIHSLMHGDNPGDRKKAFGSILGIN